MTVELVDHTNGSHGAIPIVAMEKVVNHFVWQITHHWPGGWAVADDLLKQGFFIELVTELPEAPGALAYHSVTDDGRPFSRCAVAPSLANGSDWLTGAFSVVSVVEHEYAETIGDPLCNWWVDRGPKAEVARELCDPVQDQTYRRHGADNTNFVLPDWFNPWGKGPFDYLGTLSRPFELSAGGYCIVRTPGAERDEWHAVAEQGVAGVPEYRQAALTRGRVRAGTI